MISIVLVEPEIPENTGNISRTCACTGMPLYLIGKLGFEITQSRVKRAGLDYWDKLHVEHLPDLSALTDRFGEEKFYYFSSKATRLYTDVAYPEDAFLVFGKETKGLPPELVSAHPDRALRIPMRPTLRCLNLSNSVAVAAYEALRQYDFFNMQ
ncbi:MAG TPA: tRNA (cytidine(34)-2'-O)-methyltransferase [Candidatus Protoclostridium stercorigallinarum]|uniref:Putative tRNA (cytidine(34)-2'-O)-methyltransferase n=1 Tax=Candidatus Protoclostridium stercorigallinarum TaxID=2838741 RepID=A0A9D1TS87_9FIRM|nr:tRNA (cytidine(34)-2'-O)-methyltransferase [Candidatus Protoclostridium stercorigallinarum]